MRSFFSGSKVAARSPKRYKSWMGNRSRRASPAPQEERAHNISINTPLEPSALGRRFHTPMLYDTTRRGRGSRVALPVFRFSFYQRLVAGWDRRKLVLSSSHHRELIFTNCGERWPELGPRKGTTDGCTRSKRAPSLWTLRYATSS